MVAKKHYYNYITTTETLSKFNFIKKCTYCNIGKMCFTICPPCEIDYRSDGSIKCSEKIYICDSCFNPNNVYVCKKHEKDLNIVYCDFTGQEYSESPVYYYFPENGIRRVKDSICEGCKKTYQVCNNHNTSPIKFSNCAMCLKDTFEYKDHIYGLRELRKDNFTL
jgi:hypothetical protein